MATQENPSNPISGAEAPPASTLAPEVIVDHLRALRAQMVTVTPLSAAERQQLRGRSRTSNPILQASINVIGAHDAVSQAVAQPADGVRRLYDEANRWTAVADELRTMLEGVLGANLVRRQRLSLIAAQAYNIGTQLARDPANAVLLPHVQEIKRLKSFARRKKPGDPKQSPPPKTETAAPKSPDPSTK
jgi:hypothetical protein